jgi:hypothetical protein
LFFREGPGATRSVVIDLTEQQVKEATVTLPGIVTGIDRSAK